MWNCVRLMKTRISDCQMACDCFRTLQVLLECPGNSCPICHFHSYPGKGIWHICHRAHQTKLFWNPRWWTRLFSGKAFPARLICPCKFQRQLSLCFSKRLLFGCLMATADPKDSCAGRVSRKRLATKNLRFGMGGGF